MPQTVVLDMDDLNIASTEIALLKQLKEHIPNFKVTCFTTPMHPWLQEDHRRFDHYMLWANMLRGYSDWLEIAVHGFIHDKAEMMVPYTQAKDTIKASERMFTSFKVRHKRKILGWKNERFSPNIAFAKIFKGAGWMMSNEAYQAARDMGYTIAVDRNTPLPTVPGLSVYQYNHSIEEKWPEDFAVVKAHGHMVGMANDLSQNYQKLLKELPLDATYMTISEYLQTYGPTTT